LAESNFFSKRDRIIFWTSLWGSLATCNDADEAHIAVERAEAAASGELDRAEKIWTAGQLAAETKAADNADDANEVARDNAASTASGTVMDKGHLLRSGFSANLKTQNQSTVQNVLQSLKLRVGAKCALLAQGYADCDSQPLILTESTSGVASSVLVVPSVTEQTRFPFWGEVFHESTRKPTEFRLKLAEGFGSEFWLGPSDELQCQAWAAEVTNDPEEATFEMVSGAIDVDVTSFLDPAAQERQARDAVKPVADDTREGIEWTKSPQTPPQQFRDSVKISYYYLKPLKFGNHIPLCRLASNFDVKQPSKVIQPMLAGMKRKLDDFSFSIHRKTAKGPRPGDALKRSVAAAKIPKHLKHILQ
jgi:hypothetical protein